MAKTTKSSKTTTKASKGFANPYRVGGNYHAIVATLETLGANKAIRYSAFESKLIATWDGWTTFTRKEVRNEKTHKDSKGKLRTNVSVVQRKDYGKPLHDQNACVDLFWEGQELMIRLNTKSDQPMTPGHQPKAEKVVKSAKASKKSVSKQPPILSGRDAVALLRKAK